MLTLQVTGLVAVLAVSVAAQDAVQYWIDPETVDIQTKSASLHLQPLLYIITNHSHMVL